MQSMWPSVIGKKIAHNLPEADRRDPLRKGKSSSNCPVVEFYIDGSKTRTSHMKVPLWYAVLDCGVAKSLCGAKLVAQMAQTGAREGKRVGDERDTEAVD